MRVREDVLVPALSCHPLSSLLFLPLTGGGEEEDVVGILSKGGGGQEAAVATGASISKHQTGCKRHLFRLLCLLHLMAA